MTIGLGWLQEHEKFTLPILQPISSHFSIPRLDDKPQDPIVQLSTFGSLEDRSPGQPPVSSPVLSRSNESLQAPAPVFELPLWHDSEASLQPHAGGIDCLVSWNPNIRSDSRNSPFLTEQHSGILRSSQNWIQSNAHAKSFHGAGITGSDLFGSLHLVILGASSSLFMWDIHSQSYVRTDSSDAAVFTGISPSILQRFLGLGTIVRRLEQLVQKFRERQGRTNATLHAFAHGLSTVLTCIQSRFSRGPLLHAAGGSGVHSLATLWLYYAELEKIMISLGSMCSRIVDPTSDKLAEIPISPVDLLSLVYETFETHIEYHSPRDITGVIAYILTVTSKPYIRALCKLLAYGESHLVYNTVTERTPFMDLTFDGDEVEGFSCGEGSIDAEGPFPKFIPSNLVNILPVAHKSLRLLQAAKPEHPIFSIESPSKEISWMWSEEEITNLWNRAGVDGRPVACSFQSPLDGSKTERSSVNHDPLAEFRVFNLEPRFPSLSEHDSQAVLEELTVNFPNVLPNVTPSLSILCEVMFSPLQEHATSLSRALLMVFLDRSSFLSIDAHLQLLRSHMLLTSHSFKSRLSAALFSDAEDSETHSVQLYNLLRYKSKGMSLSEQSHAGRWPVGLAPLLVTRDSWPPGGSELSFLLRTVIVESQQTGPPSQEDPVSDSDGAHHVMDEAESRLGFAIRELGGRGHDRWLDPLSIEALDFLYLDYKVPEPLQALIPTVVVSKYQRIFTLLLRLTRVECAIRSAFRLTRTTALPLFPTLSSSRQLLLHLRFAAHSFLSILSTYIYDTAIGGNFDCFLLRIANCRENPDVPSGFRDVFALAECHSSVLDDILSACLLRSSQRAAGDLLRGILEVILEFCVLVGDLGDERMAEYQASLPLEALYASFRKKVSVLIRTLEVMLERHGKPRVPGQLQDTYSERDSRVPPGGVDALRHLLTSLNQSDWWMHPT